MELGWGYRDRFPVCLVFINDSSVEEGMMVQDGEITKWWTVKVEVTDRISRGENATVTLVVMVWARESHRA